MSDTQTVAAISAALCALALLVSITERGAFAAPPVETGLWALGTTVERSTR